VGERFRSSSPFGRVVPLADSLLDGEADEEQDELRYSGARVDELDAFGASELR
jgi:hypothetical protein